MPNIIKPLGGLTTSAQLATTLTDETGTGFVVFSDSPVFTTQITTPKIVTASGDLDLTPAGNANILLHGSGTGNVIIGAATVNLHATGARLRQNNTDGAETSLATASAANRSGISLIRARGDFTTPTAVDLNDSLGFVGFKGYDGAATQLGGLVEAFVDGTISSGNVPTRVSIITGSNWTDRLERVRVNYQGNIGFNQLSFGTSALKVIAIGAGTAPTTSPADAIQMWVADTSSVAGKAGLHIRAEDGGSHVFGNYVGINTILPQTTLDVAGRGRFTDLGPNPTSGSGVEIFQTSGIAYVQGYDRTGAAFMPVRIQGSTIALLQGNVMIGSTGTPTAKIHISAGSATANTAPLQFTSGTVESTPRAGVVEYNGRFVVTESDTTNRYLVQAASSTKTTAGAPFANDGYVTAVINGTSIKLMTTA